MRRRVLHLASGDGWGGAERVIESLVHGAARLEDLELDCLIFNEGRLAQVLRGHGARITILQEQGRSPAALFLAARRWIRAQGFDVLHCHRYKELLIALFAAWPGRARIFVTVHGLEPSRQLGWKPFLVVWAAIALGRIAGVRFVAVSSELERRLRASPLRVPALHVPNPIPEIDPGSAPIDLRKRFGWSADAPIIGFVGRLEPVKGPDRFLELAARSPSEGRFVLVGGGSMESSLRAACPAGALGDRVVFVGEVPNAAPYLSEFDVVVIPSRHEGMPMIALEGAALGVPVVAFGVGDIPEVLRGAPSEWLVPPDDLEALTAALAAVLADRARARRLAGEWGAGVRARYSLASIVERYRRLYLGEGALPGASNPQCSTAERVA